MKSVAIDLTNKRFGRLLVVSRGKKPDSVKSKKAYWICKCDCGNETVVVGSSLRNKETESCGCIRNERVRDAISVGYGNAAKNKVFLDYKSRAKKMKLPFSITLEDFSELASGICNYCGSEPSNVHKQKGYIGEFTYNGIDKVVPSLGYVKENCVPCCWKCNRAKNNMSADEFLDLVKSIYSHSIKERIV